MKQTKYRRLVVFAACLALAATLSASGAPYAAEGAAGTAMSPGNSSQAAFRADMRKLWEDHIIFTRNVIISMVAGLPDLDTVVARLMQNQVDLGNAIKPYYGEAAGDKLTALLKEHISGAAEVVTAAKAGDAGKLTEAQKRWYANADEISAFLSGTNPKNWPLDTVKAMMKTHLDTTTDEAVARLKGDWAADVAAFEKVHMHILMMADALSSGIISQFPDRFGAATTQVDPPAAVTVSMTDNAYDPQEVTAAADSLITWTNNGQHSHTVTTDSPGGPKSGTIAPGQSFRWSVPAGAPSGAKYYYHCRFHAAPGDGNTMGVDMSGVIVVK